MFRQHDQEFRVSPLAAAHDRRAGGKLALALQGGGSFGAFAWGVLDRLLQEGVQIDAISGASAGAVNAVLLASGWQDGGPEEARARLDRFWRNVGRAPTLPALALTALAASTQFVSPYYYNPLGLNPLRDLLAEHVDFERLRAHPPFRLLIAATRVRDGRLRVFRESEATIETVLASSCLPMIHHAVEIDGEAYWDGAYSANPPIRQLAIDTQADDLLLVQIMPDQAEAVPHLQSEITQHARLLTFNASLHRELEAFEDVRGSVTGLRCLYSPLARKLRRQHLHRVSAADWVSDLGRHSMLDTSSTLLEELRESGREAAAHWLAEQQPEPHWLGTGSHQRTNVGSEAVPMLAR